MVGTSRQALAITVGNDRYSIADLSLTTDSHVLATEWLSHNVAILGHRNGTVQLWVPELGSALTSWILILCDRISGHQARRHDSNIPAPSAPSGQ